MGRIFAKIVRPAAFAIITFVSSYYLFNSLFVAATLSLIPLLLGLLGVMEAFSYTIAATIFIAAVIWAVAPVETKQLVKQHYDNALTEFGAGMPAAKKAD